MLKRDERMQHKQASSCTGEAFVEFCNIIDTLRSPGGCPWDIEQTHESIAGDMTEEAAEAVNAIYSKDLDNLREELGDVLQQVIFHTSIAASAGEFTIDDVIADIKAKMVRRHPHVFGAEESLVAAGFSEKEIKQATTSGAVLDMWQHIKVKERAIKEEARQKKRIEAGLNPEAPKAMLDGIPRSLPALRQATNISKKTINVGFDWSSKEEVWKKYEEERAEYQEVKSSEDALEEFGDMLFTLVNVAIKEHIDAEEALRFACEKFRTRWALMEKYAYEDQGIKIDEVHKRDKYGLEKLWQRAKKELAIQKQNECEENGKKDGAC